MTAPTGETATVRAPAPTTTPHTAEDPTVHADAARPAVPVVGPRTVRVRVAALVATLTFVLGVGVSMLVGPLLGGPPAGGPGGGGVPGGDPGTSQTTQQSTGT